MTDAATNDNIQSLFLLTQIPLWKLNEEGRLLGKWNSFSQDCAADFTGDIYRHALNQAKTKKEPVIFHGTAGEEYACAFEEKEPCFYIAGPVIKQYSKALALAGILCLQKNTKTLYEACLKQIPVLPSFKLCHFVSLLCRLTDIPCPSGKALYENNQLEDDGFMDLDFTDFLYQQREKMVPHDGYNRERALLDCVRRGDHKHLEETLASITSRPYGAALSDDEREQALFTLIACTTLITRYAIEGGLEQDTAYNLSDYYIRRAKKCYNKKEMKDILYTMSMDFTMRVAATEPHKEYSPVVAQICHHIYSNLHYEITLESLAKIVSRSKSYISALFKEETGMTITEFIRKERLKEAKNLLVNTNKSCQEIATTLSFSGQSYFTEIFKKETGLTPSEYRAQQMAAINKPQSKQQYSEKTV